MQESSLLASLRILLIIPELCNGLHHLGSYSSEKSKGYYVNTSTCKVPHVDLFGIEVKAIWHSRTAKQCTDKQDLITRAYDSKRHQYVMYVNEGVGRKADPQMMYDKSKNNHYKCTYRSIKRAGEDSGADMNYTLSVDTPFKSEYYVPTDVEGMIVKCETITGQLLQEDAFSFVQSQPEMTQLPLPLKAQRLLQSPLKSLPQPPRKPNVIMLGIDSLSRINFRRTMPNMLRYVQRSGWFEMQGYNKVSDNTFPNLLALLTGYTPERTESEICNLKSVGCLDKLPFMWQLYKKAGYVTAYAEDMSYINTFDDDFFGFLQQPVDHYLRPFYLAIEKNLPIVERFYRYNCIGRRFNVDYIYDYCQQCFEHYKNSTNPLFGLFWTSSVTHDIFEAAQTLEPTLLDYMERFEKIGLFEESIVIFFSDHGMRYGPLRALPQGFLEERLPILFIWLPVWFRQQHPEIVKALRANRNRLSSTFDLHITLQHILQLGEGKPMPLVLPKDCPHCQTLFRPLAENRTCMDAGISDHYCTCDPYETLTLFEARKLPIAQQIIDQINNYLHTKLRQYPCSNLTLNRIKHAEARSKNHQTSDGNLYHFHFFANPKDAEFSATVRYNSAKKKIEGLRVESISRLNRYTDVTECIRDKNGKKFCICLE